MWHPGIRAAAQRMRDVTCRCVSRRGLIKGAAAGLVIPTGMSPWATNLTAAAQDEPLGNQQLNHNDLNAAQSQAGVFTLYMSPYGSDSSSGRTMADALRTLNGVQRKLTQYKPTIDQDIEVR